jgi:hypothetical protein
MLVQLAYVASTCVENQISLKSGQYVSEAIPERDGEEVRLSSRQVSQAVPSSFIRFLTMVIDCPVVFSMTSLLVRRFSFHVLQKAYTFTLLPLCNVDISRPACELEL